jgi:hypothetical protein
MNFALTPFSPLDSPQITIHGVANRQRNKFSFSYTVAGNIEEIFFPSPIANPTRKDDLWKTTCFEFFIAVKNSAGYWEFNLSPSGEWNAYVMDAYRQVNMKEEMRVQRMPFTVQKDAESFSLDGDLDLSACITEESLIEVGIASVIKTNDGRESFWALTHPQAVADFHLRNNFILEFAYTG